MQSYFHTHSKRLQELGVYYPRSDEEAALPKHQYLVTDLMQGTFNSQPLQELLTNHSSVFLSSEGLTNHLYDFPKKGLHEFRDYFSGLDAAGILILREPQAWVRSYYVQCVINPPVKAAPHYATSLRLDEFSKTPQAQRLMNIEALRDDVLKAYGLRHVYTIRFEQDILEQFEKIGVPRIEGESLPFQNTSPPVDIVEMIRQVNALSQNPKVRRACLAFIQNWSKTQNTILRRYSEDRHPLSVELTAVRLLRALKPSDSPEFPLGTDSISSLFESLPDSHSVTLANFPMSMDQETALEAEVGPPGFWKETQGFQIDFLRSQGLQPDDRLLDLGCGVLRGGLPLIDYLNTGRYTGVDVRPDVITEAESLVKNFNLTSKNPALYASDNFGVSEINPNTQDMIFSFQLLYHLSDKLVFECLHACAKLLKTEGRLFANVHTVDPGRRSRWKEFPFISRPLEFYKSAAQEAGLACRDLGRMSDLGYTTELGGHRNKMLEFKRVK